MNLFKNRQFIALVFGLLLVSLSQGQMIRLKTYQFDPGNGEPAIPLNLTAREEDENYYIVQCKGPILKGWKEELKNAGIQILGYIPDYAYIVRMDRSQKDLISQREFINWIGLWHPAYKIHPKLKDKTGFFKVTILIYDTEDLTEVLGKIRSVGVRILDASECVSKLVIAEISASKLNALANIKGIHWIEEHDELEFHNNYATRTVQGGSATGDTVIWRKGIKGQGQILGTTDSGITTGHWAFYDASYPITTWGSYPNHRKIVNYSRGGSSATFGDESANYWHGTHTAGTVCGDDSYNGGTSVYDGVAKLCKLSFVDIGYSGGLSIWSDLNQLWDTSYAYGARIVSNSWGELYPDGDYEADDAEADQFMWRRKDCLLVISAGNSGPNAGTTASPGDAKSALTVGAVGRLDPTTIASYSSRGLTDDGRYKPTLMAPGGLNTTGDLGLYSAQGSTSGSGSSYWQMSGTSMAAPATCGAVGLIREYLNRGFYPTGTEVPGNAIPNPSAALLKAMAVVSTDPNITGFTVPDNDIGWGRIDLDSVLYFAGDTRKLLLHDSASGGLNTNDSVVYQWQVNSSIPLRVTLCWTDTAGNPAASRPQVNDLDLRVISPSGTSYWGNYYSGGQSATGGSRDSNNVEENFRLNSPATGTWTAWVRGRNVPTGANQPYAIVITGDVSNLQIGVVENLRQSEVVINNLSQITTLTRNRLDYTLNLSHSGKVELKIYNILGALVYSEDKYYDKGMVRKSIYLTKLPSGIYFLFFKLPDGIKQDRILLVR
uniref:Peptidase S8/S53 domain-containing protein n=1 Tax=candidate division WOR-3 bacterium TaxID=2052148 RepID=A0A7C4TGP0_UNCW3